MIETALVNVDRSAFSGQCWNRDFNNSDNRVEFIGH